jgi:uncharacterized protein YukE
VNDHVNASPEDLRRLAQQVRRSQEEISRAIKAMRSALDRTRLDDSVRRRFEEELEQATAQLARFDAEGKRMQQFLTRKATELEAFLRR